MATVREARRTDEPDPAQAALLAERAGADGITVHLREDRRHIQDHDVRTLRTVPGRVLNLELAPSQGIVAIALDVKPDQATLVPERREEITTEGGLDCAAHARRIGEALSRLAGAGIRTSLFIAPDDASVRAALALRPAAVELHTGRWAHEWKRGPAALEELTFAARSARAAGVAVHAGHGLTYDNVGPVAAIADVEELNIGHSIVSRAVLVGMERAVREMRERIDRARPQS